jgi:hypothetical protein
MGSTEPLLKLSSFLLVESFHRPATDWQKSGPSGSFFLTRFELKKIEFIFYGINLEKCALSNP